MSSVLHIASFCGDAENRSLSGWRGHSAHRAPDRRVRGL